MHTTDDRNTRVRQMSDRCSFKLAFHIFVLIILIFSLTGLIIMETRLLHHVTIQNSENDDVNYNASGTFGVSLVVFNVTF